jgi:hypothetical protein
MSPKTIPIVISRVAKDTLFNSERSEVSDIFTQNLVQAPFGSAKILVGFSSYSVGATENAKLFDFLIGVSQPSRLSASATILESTALGVFTRRTSPFVFSGNQPFMQVLFFSGASTPERVFRFSPAISSPLRAAKHEPCRQPVG